MRSTSCSCSATRSSISPHGRSAWSANVTVRTGLLIDAGTEANEPPGVGPNQAPRQGKPNTGPSEDKPVRAAGHEFQVPPVSAVIKVTVTAAAAGAV